MKIDKVLSISICLAIVLSTISIFPILTNAKIVDDVTPMHSGPGAVHWGTQFKENVGITGVEALQSFYPNNINWPSWVGYGNNLAAPTMMPPHSSIEAVTLYTRDSQTGSHGYFCIYDHVAERYLDQSKMELNSAAFSKYTTVNSGVYYYDVKIVKEGNNWNCYLFNFQTSHWDYVYGESGSSVHFGWDYFEPFYQINTPVPTIPRIYSRSIDVQINSGNWYPASSTYADVYSTGSMQYSHTFLSNFDNWVVNY
jgi:hypothetical protein